MFRASSLFLLILVALALGGLSLDGRGLDLAGESAVLRDAQTTAAALAAARAPVTDPYRLTTALRLKTTAPIPHIARTTPLDRHVGDVDHFNVARFKENDNISIAATVRVVTAHAYWYVQNDFSVNLAYLQSAAANFEDHIYPTDRKYFGSEWSPGVDGDTHITILTANIPGVGGYFSSADEYVKQVNQYSNEREMIYIAAKPEGLSGPYNFYEAVLAHEFQHMIHWNSQRDRDVWVDEGCAETAMALNNYDLGASDRSFRATPDTQLTGWSATPDPAHYGAAYLFIRYLMARYGGADFLKALLASPGPGPDAVTAALRRMSMPIDFEDVFKDWTVANYINDPTVGDGRYGYAALSGRVSVDKRVVRYPATVTEDAHEFAADYVSLERGGGDTVVDFQGATTTPLLPTTPHSGRRFWYSNRRDFGDTTLTRPFDLTNAPRATLDFWSWYDLDAGFDYGYVEVSTDGGQTWTPQRAQHTTDANPNGQSYGPAFTGASGRAAPAAGGPLWVHDTVDLAPFAGRRILARFEVITDESYNAPGWAVDDISVPEIGYHSDAESDDGGWQAAGWARVGATVPQRWFVAALEYGAGAHAVQVQTLTLDERQHGRLTIPGLGTTTRQAILVIAPLAPVTTEKAAYRVQFSTAGP
jgi:immune inhibitor A